MFLTFYFRGGKGHHMKTVKIYERKGKDSSEKDMQEVNQKIKPSILKHHHIKDVSTVHQKHNNKHLFDNYLPESRGDDDFE